MKSNFWKRGKEQQREFYNIPIKNKTSILGTILGLIVGAIILLPYALVLFQFIYIYGYNRKVLFIYLFFILIGIMLFNGVLNYSTIKFSKSLEKDNLDLSRIEEKYVFYYQCLNPAFAGISLLLIIFFAYYITGGFK